jgi:FAD binding domain
VGAAAAGRAPPRRSPCHTLTGFEANADGVSAQIQGPDGETLTVDCRWLVSCDGAHSKVRATLGFDFAGGQYPQTFVLADLEVDCLSSIGRIVPLASQTLLDSYSVERHAVGLDVVENTSRALNDVLVQRAQLPGMRETQLLINYRGSPIVKDERTNAATAPIAAGDRVPDAGG